MEEGRARGFECAGGESVVITPWFVNTSCSACQLWTSGLSSINGIVGRKSESEGRRRNDGLLIEIYETNPACTYLRLDTAPVLFHVQLIEHWCFCKLQFDRIRCCDTSSNKRGCRSNCTRPYTCKAARRLLTNDLSRA